MQVLVLSVLRNVNRWVRGLLNLWPFKRQVYCFGHLELPMLNKEDLVHLVFTFSVKDMASLALNLVQKVGQVLKFRGIYSLENLVMTQELHSLFQLISYRFPHCSSIGFLVEDSKVSILKSDHSCLSPFAWFAQSKLPKMITFVHNDSL